MYLHHNLEPIFNVTSLVNASMYHMTTEFQGFGESHNFWELVYCDKGELVVQANENHYIMKAGEMIFHCPGEWHDLRANSNQTADAIVLAFSCDSPLMAEFEKKIIFLDHQEKECLSSIVAESAASYEYFDNDPPYVKLIKKNEAPVGCDQVIKSQLELLLIYLFRKNNPAFTVSREISSNGMHQHEHLAAEAKQYLQNHFSEKITLMQVASALGISISLLKKVFREQTGTTVVNYLTSLRISESKRLIRGHNLNFTQIAEALGYDNIHYFSSQFKKQTGMTPTEYSRSVRQ